VDGFFKHRERQAGELEVELIAGDAFAGAAEFEVHVAVEVFGADDVEQHLVFLHRAIVVVLGDETDGDAADGADQRHTGVEQRHGAGANGGHRGGAVGLGDFRGNADGVGEIGFVRDDRLDRALGERAVADLAAVDATHAAGFTDGEGREVVVQDEALLVFATGVVVECCFSSAGASVVMAERLGFATGEDGGAVNARQGADFAVERAEVADGCGRRRARLFP
jgi:hypothetical protein